MIVGILALLSGSASAANWVSIGANPTSELFVDTASIGPRGAWTKAWFKFEHSTPQEFRPPQSQKYRASKQLHFFNCKERTYAVAQAMHYEDMDGMGNVVSSETYTVIQKDFKDAAPETFGETMIKTACAPRKSAR